MLLQYRDDISYRIVLENIHRYGFNLIHQHNNDRSHVSALGLISTFDCSVYHIMLYRVHIAFAVFELTMLVVIGTDCICSYKSKHHTFTTTTDATIEC
jgi:hypothetical protein